jgi:hypothetical protein
MKVTIEETPKSAQELQWVRRGKHNLFARSVDGVRQYHIIGEEDRSGIIGWRLAWREKQDEPIKDSAGTFMNQWEVQEIAQLIENEHEINEEELVQIAAGNAVTIGGNVWKYYGVHDNKRLWIAVAPDEQSAYVATCDYDDPKRRWVVSKRTWTTPLHSSSASADESTLKEHGMQTLVINRVGTYKDLQTAQRSAGALTYNSSNSSLTKTEDTSPKTLPSE